MKTAWLHTYARELYLGLSSKNPTVAQEYIEALAGDASLQRFCERHSDPASDEVRDFESAPARKAMAKLHGDSKRKGRA